jgi:hypothetical protein
MINRWATRWRLLGWQERLKLLPELVGERLDPQQAQGSWWVCCHHGGLPRTTQDMEVVRPRLVLASKVRPAQASGLLFLRLVERVQ